MQRKARFWAKCACFVAALAIYAPVAAKADGITAFAASSLHDALGEIARMYQTETGVHVTLVFAASSAVARQVANGAPADVVLLADVEWGDWLVAQGAVDHVDPFAGNRLVVIGRDVPPFDDPADISAIVGDGVLAMAQVDAVPAGRYGRAALDALGLWDGVSARVVQAANVRAALRFVQRGEARLGIGYASDLVALPDLSQVYGFAPDTHPKIMYSGGSVTDEGRDFMTYIRGEDAQKILTKWGFSPVHTP